MDLRCEEFSWAHRGVHGQRLGRRSEDQKEHERWHTLLREVRDSHLGKVAVADRFVFRGGRILGDAEGSARGAGFEDDST